MNIPTLEKSASMASSGVPPEVTPETMRTKSRAAEAPKSPTGVWDLSFLSHLINGDQQQQQQQQQQQADTSDGNSVASVGDQSVSSQQNMAPLPERLIDFFCVVGPELDRIRDFAQKPKDLKLAPKLMDCYPPRQPDVDFPDELPMFCLPNGSQLSTEQRSPTLATFVLTSSQGNRLYGSVLTTFELVPLEELCQAFWKGECLLPKWLEDPSPFYLPKCLVVISHHAFYDVQRQFLKQLYRIASCGCSPLPLERFVANFVHDVPLPRPGAAKIAWNCFTKDTTVTYRRPATNELPLVNYSYQPIFRCLSVANILTLWGVLLQEGRVVLQSENQALLTPVAEALTSFLFPLTWAGMYVPVLPLNMIDILEAPVPFLVGFAGKTCPQPAGVVVCDLDQDIVHLGTDDYNQSRILPQLPKPLISHLKLELEEVGDPLYLIPPCGIKGRITTEVHGLLENYMRESYAHMVELRELSLSNTHRQFILDHASFVPPSKTLIPGDFILIGEEQTKYQSLDTNAKPKNRRKTGNIFKTLKRQSRAIQGQSSMSAAAANKYDEKMEKEKFQIASGLYEVDDYLAKTARFSFLRFFSSLLMRYKDFNKNGTFRHEEFVKSLTEISHGNRLYVESILKTQMFERFLVESSTRRRLFDEHVLVQQNENVLAKKQETPFLDQQVTIVKTVIPAAPCAAGVRRGMTFEYEKFPKLDTDEFVANKTLDPISALCYLGSDVFCGGGFEW